MFPTRTALAPLPKYSKAAPKTLLTPAVIAVLVRFWPMADHYNSHCGRPSHILLHFKHDLTLARLSSHPPATTCVFPSIAYCQFSYDRLDYRLV